MASSLLTKPLPTRALLICRLHHASPLAMGVPRLSTSFCEVSVSANDSATAGSSKVGSGFQLFRYFLTGVEENTMANSRMSMRRNPVRVYARVVRTVGSDAAEANPVHRSSSTEAFGWTGTFRTPSWTQFPPAHANMKQRSYSTSSGPTEGGPYKPVEGAGSPNTTYPEQQPPYSANNSTPNPTYPQQRPAFDCNRTVAHPNPTYSQPPPPPQQQKPAYPSNSNRPFQQGNVPSSGAPLGSNAAEGGPKLNAPRTSAAAEVIDKYLGPSTLKLEKRDNNATPPPPPPPRRNYGAQGTQEKKSGKDLVAESAACAVIEKYLGPWPGFPPRDPKIDEYLDSLPENAACAAIDKYFGPYKPLFVFKKNEENPDNPPPPSRPPRNRMMSRARNRSWNQSPQGASVDRPWTGSQQGASVDRPWTGPQQGPSVDRPGVLPTQGGAGGMPPAQGAGGMPHPQGGGAMLAPQGTGTMPPPQAGSDSRQLNPPSQGASDRNPAGGPSGGQ